MDDKQRLNLKKMMSENGENETTELIRETKHSVKIGESVRQLTYLKKKYARLAKTNPQEFDLMCKNKCEFLYDNYTDIYNKVKKDEIDLLLLSNFLSVLKDIEDGKLDQHDASFKVGSILKKIYIDSALKHGEKKDNEQKHKSKKGEKKVKVISWEQYKLIKK